MEKKDLRIVFMGTPEFAVGTLQALEEGGYNVVAVVTQPDKPVGRHGSVLCAPAVKVYAEEHGIPVMQPEKMKDAGFVEQLRSYNADLQVVVAFRMLPEVVWAMPRLGTFNVHAALLPQYRGAAPINWAIINGETRTGVTTFFLDHDIDTGRIIMQKPFDIPDDADVEYVYDGLMALGAKAAVETIEKIIENNGEIETLQQEEMIPVGETLKGAPKIYKETCEIDWTGTAKQVHDFVRGLSPVPGAHGKIVTEDGTEMEVKIYKGKVTEQSADGMTPGAIVREKKHLYVATGEGLYEVLSLQAAGKKRMDAISFMNGLR
ncbi:MAG: methionyl-tRNA formyltransferase [Prevotella sp.]|nr:methionyl-tRNA formyltransferase [Prevotella sp.]